MPSVADVFSVLHLGILAVFVGGTSVLMLVAILSRLRVRRPLMSWSPGPLTPIPVGPTLFLSLVVVVLAYLGWTARPLPPSAVVGYPAGGFFWFIATWVGRSILVTDYGLVPDLSRLHRAVAWSQIDDFACSVRDGRVHFVFLYTDRTERSPRRLDLPVPDPHVDAFRSILREKLEERRSPFGSRMSADALVGHQDDSSDRL